MGSHERGRAQNARLASMSPSRAEAGQLFPEDVLSLARHL